MADYFSWATRVDRDGKPAGCYTSTPVPVTEASTTYSVKNDENPTGKTFTLGTKYYVNGAVAEDTGNGSWETPFKTISHAVNDVSAGNKTIIIRGANGSFDGVYDEYIDTNFGFRSGTDDTHRYMLVGYGQERPILDGTGLGDQIGIRGSGGSYITFQRMRIQDFDNRGIMFQTPGSPATAHVEHISCIDLDLYNCTSGNNADGNLHLYGADNTYSVNSAWVFHCTSGHTYGKGIKVADHTHDTLIEWNYVYDCGWWAGISTHPAHHPYGIDSAADTPTQHNLRTIWRYNIVGSCNMGNEIRYPEDISIHHNEFYDSFHFSTWDCQADTPYTNSSPLHIRWMLGTGSIYGNIIRDNADTGWPWLLTFVSVASSTGPYQVYNNLLYNPAGTVKTGAAAFIHGYGGLTNLRKVDFFNNSFYWNSSSSYPVIQIDNPTSPATNAFVIKNNLIWQVGAGACLSADAATIDHDYNKLYHPSGTAGCTVAAHETETAPGWSTVPVGAYSADSEAILTAVDAGLDVDAVCAGTSVDANLGTRVAWDKGWLEYEAGVDPPGFYVYYNANGATGGTVPVDNSEYPTSATVTVLGNIG